MYRALLCIIAAILLLAPVGCRSCAHPFDYCGPTFTNDCGCPCDPNSRAGSILVPEGAPIPGTLTPEPAPENAPLIAPKRSGDAVKPLEESMLPSSGVQLIAETDRAASESEQEAAPILTPVKKPVSPSTQNGWTARKSKSSYR